MRLTTVLLAIALASAAPAGAQSALADARRAGIVGERYDGYLGIARGASSSVRNQVSAINIKRRALYTSLATRRGITTEVAAVAAGCELLSRVAVGQVYMLEDGAWRRRGAGEGPPRPGHCPER